VIEIKFTIYASTNSLSIYLNRWKFTELVKETDVYKFRNDDSYIMRGIVEINTLEELMDLYQTIGKPLIIKHTWLAPDYDEEVLAIEIYDGYRE